MTSKGRPFHTAVFPPPRNVGTPDSADTPAPVSTSTRPASAKRRRSSAEIVGTATVVIASRDGNRQDEWAQKDRFCPSGIVLSLLDRKTSINHCCVSRY